MPKASEEEAVRSIKPNPKVIDMLEKVLVDAKSGEIQSIAICGVTDDVCTFNCFVVGVLPTTPVGEIRVLERDVIDCHVELRMPVSAD